MFDPLEACKKGRNVVKLCYEEDDDCSICKEPMRKKKVKYLKCTHRFHVRCTNDWLKESNTCPICRIYVSDDFEEDIKFLLNELIAFYDTLDSHDISLEA